MGAPAAAGAAKGGFFNRPGMGMLLGGLAAGFLGAGLFGMLSGGGMFSGLGGLSSIIGLMLQIGLIIIVVRAGDVVVAAPPHAGVRLCRRPCARVRPRRRPASAPEWALAWDRAARRSRSSRPTMRRSSGCSAKIQAAWSNEDVAKLHTLATPEMVSYFSKDLEQNKANNDVNKVSDVKLLQGDLAEAWREGETDYASVAMRFSLVDKTLERATGRLVSGSETPIEATEVWTFARQRGGNWELSAIQQTN